MTRLAIGTIVAKNYLPFARVLAHSLRRHHSDRELVVALADEFEGHFEPESEPFSLLTPADLGVPDLRDLAFRMKQREFAIALKPFFVERLLVDADSALFLDPDMLVLGDLGELFEAVEEHSLTLVPHSLEPPAGPDRIKRELVLHRAGVFNGGVVGARRDSSALDFLHWWQQRVHKLCTYAVDRGIHYDQRWLDLALGFVEDLHVHRDVGVDVAHWNLPERPVRVRDGAVTAADVPGRLFHFSGFDPDRPDLPTRYRPELTFAELGEARELFREYELALDRAGWADARDLPYAYGTFANGIAIPEVARRAFAETPDRERLGDPFESYFRGAPSNLWLGVHRLRPDLQRAFPQPLGRDRRRFLAWTRKHGASEHDVPPELT